MSVYTVHEPPPRKGQSAADPERFAFVRDGFHFWAFVLTPLWMLRRRLWLVLILYLVLTMAIEIGLHVADAPWAVSVAAALFISLLVAIEAGTLRRWTLARRGWKNLGVVVGDDLESAERRFFDAWTRTKATLRPPPPPAAESFRMPRAVTDIIGLFPEPGARR